MKMQSTFLLKISRALSVAVTVGMLGSVATVSADETCMSPYMAKITGQEDFVYVWTLGVEGLGDGQDKLVTVDVNPSSDNYGKVIDSLSVGGRNEAHHSGFTDDRKYLWAGGLDTNKIFIFDVHTDPAKPTLHHVIEDFVAKSGGVVGPHTTYALPGRMMITVFPITRIMAGERLWWNTRTPENMWRLTGCRPMTTCRERLKGVSSRMDMVTISGSCPERTLW